MSKNPAPNPTSGQTRALRRTFQACALMVLVGYNAVHFAATACSRTPEARASEYFSTLKNHCLMGGARLADDRPFPALMAAGGCLLSYAGAAGVYLGGKADTLRP